MTKLMCLAAISAVAAVLATHYAFALMGHPSSVWLMQSLGLL